MNSYNPDWEDKMDRLSKLSYLTLLNSLWDYLFKKGWLNEQVLDYINAILYKSQSSGIMKMDFNNFKRITDYMFPSEMGERGSPSQDEIKKRTE